MKDAAFAAHRAAASGLFVLFSLLAIVLRLGDPRLIALAAGGALAAQFTLTRPAARAALGPFAAPLAMAVDLLLLLCAMSLTGGALSPFALLLPAGVALAWTGAGRAAGRFYAAASLIGVGALAGLGGLPTAAGSLFALAALALSAPALLAALEIASPPVAAEPAEVSSMPHALAAAEPPPVPRVPARAAAAEPPSAPRRDPDAEILHDLRSPLSVIRVYTDLIQEAARRGELPNAEYLTNLAREIELAERLVGTPDAGRHDDAEAARLEEHLQAPQSADLVEILGSLATAYRLAHGGRVRIEFIAERPQLPVRADPVALQRAFRNVLDNAIKYTPDAGEVRIRAGSAGTQAFVVVKDTGMGMSPEERARAFDYAFRGAGAVAAGTRGKGLGLAVTKEILEANGGKISLSSEAGYGSEVTIMLPYRRNAR
ncbi:MAG TPA: HAMP domain-containing sensor histidine kinase [Thermoanaerobaculia bacterium]|nr:HAMP domain-containing sensor histidine kinase [Thermoanaerobaculia bacterium]